MNLRNLFFIQKISGASVGFLSVFVLLCCMSFTSPMDKSKTSTYSHNPYLEEMGLSFFAGPNDTIDIALVISTAITSACPGDVIPFTIEIVNQDPTPIEVYEITNYIPAGLSLGTTGNTGWVLTGNKAKKTINSTLPGNGFNTESISLVMDSTFAGNFLENRAEISWADCDSDPTNGAPFEIDSNLDDIDDDFIGGDNIIDNSFGDEDDHDLALVTNAGPIVSDIAITPSLCNFDNGTVTITPNTSDSYVWSDGGTGASRTDLFAGIYNVTITEVASGCSTVQVGIEVTNDCTGCEAIAGTVTMVQDTFCLTGDTICVNFTDDGNSFEPQPQFITSYFLTTGPDNAILAVDTAKQFKITEKGSYRIHVKVFDVLHIPPEEVDSVIVGVTPIDFLNTFLQQGGGYLCGDLDLVGVPFEVGSASTTVDSIAISDCFVADGYALLSPDTLDYVWSDGGTGFERNDLAPGNHSVTVTGCANCLDTVDIFIGNNCILNDTIPFILEVDSTETFCSNGIPLIFSNNTVTTLCDGSTSGTDGTYGSFTVSETGCLVYTSNLIPGNSIDTICVVVTDDLGNADTTVFIPSIICHTVPVITNVPCDATTMNGDICLDIPFDSITLYNVVVDGIPMTSGFIGCNNDSLIIYDYSSIFAQGNLGPYTLDAWGINGIPFTFTFNSMTELVAEMNNLNPTGNWILNPSDLIISGGNLSQTYDDIVITHDLTNTMTTIPAVVNFISAGTTVTLSVGSHQIVYTKIGENCPEASLQANVSCTPCTPFLPSDTVMVIAPSCVDMGEFCFGISTADIFNYTALVDGIVYAGSYSACNFTGMNDGTSIQLAMGTHTVVLTEIATGCIDSVIVDVSCTPCTAGWLPPTVELETSDCGDENTFVCLNVPATTLSNFNITDNGALFNGSTQACMNGTDAAISVDTGFHRIIMMDLITGCADTMDVTVNCIPDTIFINEIIEVTTNDTVCLDEMLVGDIDDIDIFCGDTTDLVIDYTFDTLTNCIVFEGTVIGTDTLCFVVRNQNGDSTLVFMSIVVTPPCGVGFISTNVAELGLSDCAGTTELCIDINLNNILNYTITDNGLPYSGMFQGCDFDTSFSYSYFTMPDQGTAGPYNVDSWTVNGQMFSGSFMTINDFLDSLNTWDATGTWTINTTTLIVSGGNPGTSYGDITVTQTATGAFALLELNLNLIANGTSLLLTEGPHEVVFVDTATMCTDTVMATVYCIDPEIIIDTISIADIENLCIDTSELIGNIVSITNICPDQSGTEVQFTIDPVTYCMDYEGLNIGQDTACIIVCDDLGLCDTTTVIVIILPDDLPVAVNDLDTTMINTDIVLNIVGNDTIGTFDTMYINNPPVFGDVTINADGTVTYVPDTDYCDNDTPDEFTYVVCDTNGCDSATVNIWVLCDPIVGDFEIFNGFSPNGDGVNDNFHIEGVEAFPGNILCIFNRWGNLVYLKEDYDNTYNGEWENVKVPDGTYFYVWDDGIGNRFSGYVQIAR